MSKRCSLRRQLFLYTLRFIELGMALCLWGWVVGFIFFNHSLDRLRPHLPSTPIDAIVVFTGRGGRVQTGIALLKRGIAPRLLISGVRSQRQKVLTSAEKGLPITLDYAANDTFENVGETVSWLQARGYSSICLVTSDFHMPRSLFLLYHKMPCGIFYPYPLKTAPAKRLPHALREYHKLLACLFFQSFWEKK